ncbi:hypothetical protein MFIFM68171_09609 [Madurella fahalii]|uniref:AAA+ ATPase domain-containing protein n=1 Tax=Madurella fahalii TaxID=1157608 RepID=A0ABQ0GNU9_9PEZI
MYRATVDSSSLARYGFTLGSSGVDRLGFEACELVIRSPRLISGGFAATWVEKESNEDAPGLATTKNGGPESYDDLIRRMRRECNDYESNLADNIADLREGPGDHFHVHLDPTVTIALETSVHISLVRGSELKYGVLQRNRLTGAVVFGPPGTGKTLASQVVARKCRLNMLTISSSDIFHKCWGDDEKAIRAAFGLARKLYPCIMFIDEADGILGKHREDDKKFVRSMLNVPSLEGRKGILRILPRDEKFGEGLTIDLIAGLTRSFSGSDLKNLCVSAAMGCIQEQVPDENGQYPERRELCRRHFDFAFRYVKPSVSDKFMSRKLLEFQRNSV